MHNRIYVLRFQKNTSNEPVIYHLVKEFDIEFNILKADILPQREGLMILGLKGTRENVKKGLKYLEGYGVTIKKLATVISRDEQKCYQCGACTGVCPVSALSIRKTDMAVIFEPEICTGCGQCVPICPVRAMEVSLEQEVLAEEILT